MNPIASYFRHLVVTAIVLLLAKCKFPLEGADAFADALAVFVCGTIVWAIVKYLPDLAKAIGLVCAACMILPSCGTVALLGGYVFRVLTLALVSLSLLLLPSCNLSVGADGRPVIGVDPIAIAQTIQALQAKHGGKAATVVIVDPQGKVIPTLPPVASPAGPPVVPDK